MCVVAYLTLEQQLESLGARWGSVCRVVEQSGVALGRAVALWGRFDELYTSFSDWLMHAENTVSQLETVDSLSDVKLIVDQVQRLKVLNIACD